MKIVKAWDNRGTKTETLDYYSIYVKWKGEFYGISTNSVASIWSVTDPMDNTLKWQSAGKKINVDELPEKLVKIIRSYFPD